MAKHVEETDGAVEQRVDCKQGSFPNAVAFPRMAQVLDHGILADSQDPRNLPVGLASSRPHHAFALAVGQPHRAGRKAHALHPARSFESESSDELEEWQMVARHWLAGNPCEGAGAVCFARDMGRDSEAIADSVAAREVQDLEVLLCKRDHAGKLGPGKADARHVARTVNRIRSAERLLVEPFSPIIWVIVDSNSAAVRSNVDMMGQREIAKAKIARNVIQSTGKLGFRP